MLLAYVDKNEETGEILDTWILLEPDFEGGGEGEYLHPSIGADLSLIESRDSLDFGGEWDSDQSTSAVRIATMSYLEIALEQLLPGRPLDEAAGDLQHAVEGELIDDRLLDLGIGVDIGIELPLLYTDGDGDYALGEDDDIRAWACWDGETVGFFYLPYIPDPVLAYIWPKMGLHPGWNGVLTSADLQFVDQDTLAALTFSDSDCEFGGF